MTNSRIVTIHNCADQSAQICLRSSQAEIGAPLELPAQSRYELYLCQAQLLTPRASSPDAFADAHLELRIGDRVHCLWQQDASSGEARVRVSADGRWSAPGDANLLPGLPAIQAGAESYQLIIDEDGSVRGELDASAAAAEDGDEVDPLTADAFTRARSAATKEIEATRAGRPSARGRVHRIDAIYKEIDIAANKADKDKTFGRSLGNRLHTNWLIQTPDHWGRSAAELPTDHSRSLGTHIEAMLAKATTWIDLLLLHPAPNLRPSDWFFKCLVSGLQKALAAANNTITLRILIGQYPFNIAATHLVIEALLKELGRTPGKLEIHAAAVERKAIGQVCWNHSKLVAVDGKLAMVGGHNLWERDYLCWAPVHDVSMQIEGPAAQHSHRFCDQLWQEWFATGGLSVWRHYANTEDRRVHRNHGELPMSGTAAPGPGTGDTPVLAIGCRGGVANGKSNHSTFALLLALNRASRSIKLSQQDLRKENFDNHLVMDALAYAILRGVSVHVVLSSDGAESGGGISYKNGHGEARFVHEEITKRARKHAARNVDVDALIAAKLKVAQLRFSADEVWPKGTGRFNGQPRHERKIANHAKVVIVDDRLFYVGAENLYPIIKRIIGFPIQGSLQDYGFFVEGEEQTRELLEQYWAPLWFWSSRTTLHDRDGGVPSETPYADGASGYSPWRASVESFFVGDKHRLGYAFRIRNERRIDRQSFATIGEPVGSALAAVHDPIRRHNGVFYISRDDKLHYVFLHEKWRVDNSQPGWKGMNPSGPIAAIYNPVRRHPEVLSTSTSGHLRYSFNKDGWQQDNFGNARIVGREPASLAAAYSPMRSNPDVYYLDGDGDLLHLHATGNGPWKSWKLDARSSGWLAAVYNPPRAHTEVYFCHQDGSLGLFHVEDGAWKLDTELAALAKVSGPIAAAYSDQRGHSVALFRGDQGLLCFASKSDGKWSVQRDAFAAAGKIAVSPGAISAVYHPVRRHVEVFALSEDGRRHSFWVDRRKDADGAWQHDVWES